MGKKNNKKAQGKPVIISSGFGDVKPTDEQSMDKDQQQAEFNKKVGVNSSQKVKEAPSQEFKVSTHITSVEKVQGQNDSERIYHKICKDITIQTEAHYEHNHF